MIGTCPMEFPLMWFKVSTGGMKTHLFFTGRLQRVQLSATIVALGLSLAYAQEESLAETNDPVNIQIQEPEARPEPSAADRQLQSTIDERLESDRLVDSHQVRVTVLDGRATLEGTVDTVLAKERALALARATEGVGEIRDQVQVAVAGRADWEILADAQTAFRRDPALTNSLIQGAVENGILTLTGSVESNHRKVLAEALAKGVKGVAQVENELHVEVPPHRADSEIRADVLSRIAWDPWLRNPAVGVEVKQGNVIINGVVDSENARERLRKDALVMGVREVSVAGVKVDPQFAKRSQPSVLTPTGREEKNSLQETRE